ncbi:phosphoribosylanthranilate isomerase [Actinokineospora sp. HUAS TT18]|uniref:phosphoribosylanthranilate isomerase n=1 Tax=Actinokineospora sp. HUAS TT18 TaxID=3447451 RepID=UPI003F525086
MTSPAGREETLLKTCGATSVADVELLAAAGADLVGLWHGVPGGPAELDLDTLVELAAAARATGVLEPVLVTFLSDVDRLSDVLVRAGITWVQLHAYQSPLVVKGLRKKGYSGLKIVKVLHVSDGDCVERRLVPAYERAGTDVFLLDRVGDNGQVGSTGQQLLESAVADLLPSLTLPFLLAGGINAENRADYPLLTSYPGYLGIDVDTAARDHSGRFSGGNVAAIAVEWRTARSREVVG